MITIVEPKEAIAKLWGKQKVRESDTYRLMRYVLRVDHEGKVLLHNVVTGQLVVLSEEEARALDQLPTAYTPTMEQLVSEHYLVSEDYDEYRSVNQLRRVFQSRDTGSAINHYIILPTTYCNARCFYCYESDYPRVHMTEETASKLVEYIAEHREGKPVKLSWFGGEPLVGMARIDQITQALKDREISFESSMISNGYLFDEDVVRKSVELWNLKDIQITLDGTEEVYNRAKAFVNVMDNPFERVLGNIDLLASNGIYVRIRLNIDFYNKDDIRELIETLGKKYAGNGHVFVYMNMLYNDRGYEPVHHSDEDILELQQIIADYTDRLKQFGLGNDGLTLPFLQASQCMADNSHAIEIQPDGGFCRCEHENTLDSYGSLEKGVLNPGRLVEWKVCIERSDYCPNCHVYPSCFLLKRCLSSKVPCSDAIRKMRMKQYSVLLRSVYQNSLKESHHE